MSSVADESISSDYHFTETTARLKWLIALPTPV